MTQHIEEARKLELWFFRDISDEQRMKLFSLFGIPAKDANTHGAQKKALRRVFPSIWNTMEGEK